jgi:hypothetical protein
MLWFRRENEKRIETGECKEQAKPQVQGDRERARRREEREQRLSRRKKVEGRQESPKSARRTTFALAKPPGLVSMVSIALYCSV